VNTPVASNALTDHLLAHLLTHLVGIAPAAAAHRHFRN
jgi:hypothetical protein